MAKKIKYTEKELKGPDQFTRTVISGFEYFADHTTKILVIVVAIIVVLAAAYTVSTYSGKKEEKASVMFDAAVEEYESGNYEQALNEFLLVNREFSGSNISNIALYYAGLINYRLGNYDESVNNLNGFLGSGVNDRILDQSAIFTQGLARYKQGKWQEAIDYLSKVSSAPEGGPYTAQARLLSALSYEKLGKPEQAETLYRELNQNQPAVNSGMSPVTINPSSQSGNP